MKKALTVAATVATLALALSACGSNPSSSQSSSSSAAGSSGSSANGPRAGQGGFNRGRDVPGAAGKIAAMSGHTAQVQSTSAQTAVTWTSATTFTREKTLPSAVIKVGDCVMAMPKQPSRSAGSSTSGSSGSSTVAADTVRILGTSGDCTSGFGGAGGGQLPGRGRPSGMPSGAPSGVPSGAPQGQRPGGARGGFGGFGAIGKVIAVSGSGFTVKSTLPNSARTVGVTTSSSTTYTETAKANASAVKVGLCMTAQGSTDSTGAVTAKRISLTEPTGGNCLGGFGGGPGGQPNGPNGNA